MDLVTMMILYQLKEKIAKKQTMCAYLLRSGPYFQPESTSVLLRAHQKDIAGTLVLPFFSEPSAHHTLAILDKTAGTG